MKVTVSITRRDLFRFSLYIGPRLKANWIFFGILVVGGFAWISWQDENPVTTSSLAINLFSALVGGIIGMTVGMVICILIMLFSVTHDSGQLGPHEYEIRADGLFEKTSANEALYRWAGIQSITRSAGQIYVRVHNYMFHVFPRHSFSGDEEFDRYFNELYRQWQAAATQQAVGAR